MVTHRIREHLCEVAQGGRPITYQALAKSLDLAPPNTIQQLTVGLEQLMEEDATAARPMIAALVVSKAGDELPRQGFFECAQRAGRFHGNADGPEAVTFHRAEFKSAVEFWGSHLPSL